MIGLLLGCLCAPSAVADQQVSFAKDIAPILASKCLTCHGPQKAEADYRLDTFERLLKSGSGGEQPVVAGDVEQSDLFQRLTTDDEDLRMPAEADPLPDAEIDLIRKWIADGAHFDGELATTSINELMPIVIHPAPPDLYPRPLPISAIRLSQDAERVYVSGYHEITVWSLEGQLLSRIGDQGQRTYSIELHPEKPILMSASGTPGELGEVRLFDLVSGDLLRVVVRASEVIMDAKFSPNGSQIAFAMPDGNVRLIGATDSEPIQTLSGHSGAITSLSWRSDGKQIVTASVDKTAKVFDLEKGRSTATFSGHTGIVNAVTFAANHDHVLSASDDGTLQLWSAGDGRKQRDVLRDDEPIFCVAADEDRYIVSGNGWIRQMELASHREISISKGHRDWLTAIDFDAKRGRAVVGSQSGEIVVLDTKDNGALSRFVALPKSVVAKAK